jgi:CheY-like chemotaxis protein
LVYWVVVGSKRDSSDEAYRPAMKAGHGPILVAEDDENDAFLLRKAFLKAGLTERLVFTSNGEETVKYLRGEPPYDRKDNPLPCLILLDLKMPIVDGFDVLAWLKTQPALSSLPAIVFSSSGEPADIQKARSLGAADFQVKPSNFSELVKVVRQLEFRWLKS